MAEQTMLDPSQLEGKYLTVTLMDELYGVSVDWIMQIIDIPNITMIPKTPEFVKGVINLRGQIIPVIDLRLKFGLPPQEYNARTSIVVIHLKLDSGNDLYVGIIIDTVHEVLDIEAHDIEKAPTFGAGIETQFILGMAKVKQRVVTLLNIARILTDEELSRIASM